VSGEKEISTRRAISCTARLITIISSSAAMTAHWTKLTRQPRSDQEGTRVQSLGSTVGGHRKSRLKEGGKIF
jgi:hypothetical protein